MNEVERIAEVKDALKYCKHEEVKEKIKEKIKDCLISNFQYCMFIQAIISDAEDITPQEWTDKYGKIAREKLDEGMNISDIMLCILDEKYCKDKK